VSYSLNELEATAKKAVRGAGYPWGLAEEAGKSAVWLCQHDIDGCAILSSWLEQFDNTYPMDQQLNFQTHCWSATNGVLCPLIAGSALSDYATILTFSMLRIRGVVHPALLFFFAAMTAQQRKTTVSLLWPGTLVLTDGAQLSVNGAIDSATADIVIKYGDKLGRPNAIRTRVEPDLVTWSKLRCFSSRIYAPATEESRLRGAGSGLSNTNQSSID